MQSPFTFELAENDALPNI